jgi:nitrite reductase (cytochrome c-552)
MLKAQHPGYELYKTGIHGLSNVACADCHMPAKREGTIKFSDHGTGNPLDNMEHSCLVCHRSTEKELRAIVGRKLERKDELHYTAMNILAKAHLEAGKAWEVGATEEEMAAALQDIRHGQWRWDYAVASHGGFFHAPDETLRILGSAIAKAQEARLKLRIILSRYDAAEFVAADFSTKEKAHEIIGLPYDKLVEDKDNFLNTLRQEWIEDATEKGLFDPATREGMDNI